MTADRLEHGPRLPSWPTALILLGITLAATALLWLGAQEQAQNTDRRQAAAAAALASEQRDALAGSVEALREQVQDLGEQPVEPPATTTVQEVRPVASLPAALRLPGPTGATGAQGPPGPSGSAGAAATASAGPTGPAGADGVGVPGADGAAGAAGQDGRDGSDGRGVASLSCEGSGQDSTWVVTYTDGTTSVLPGPCRVEAPPSAAPTPTPTEAP